MSTAVSRAAKELADAMCPDLKPEDLEIMAGVVQSHLVDLLEKARKVTDHTPGVSPIRNVARYSRLKMELKQALEPWKAGE